MYVQFAIHAIKLTRGKIVNKMTSFKGTVSREIFYKLRLYLLNDSSTLTRKEVDAVKAPKIDTVLARRHKTLNRY